MLKIKFNKYEIEEQLELINSDGEVIDILDIKITPNEFKILKDTIINKDTLKLAKEMQDNKVDYEKALDLSDKAEKLIIDTIIKDKKEIILKNAGEVGLESVVETIYDFLLHYLVQKNQQRVNTMNTNHTKNGKK